jgi:adenylate cyclase
MKRSTYLKLKQLRAIVIVWVMLGFIITVYDHLLLYTRNSLGPSEEYSFLISAIRNTGAGLIGSLVGGSILVFVVNVKYNDRPYWKTVVYVSVSFLLTVVLITLVIGSIVTYLRTERPVWDPAFVAAFKTFVMDTHPIKSTLAWSIIVAMTQLMIQVDIKFGQGVFGDIATGKYHTPRTEKRVFMFLDINSSTTIAERLGDETYHRLLRDFFADITNPILENRGSIYQYVGDEVIVSWNYKDGIEDAGCISCYFDIKNYFDVQREKYLHNYGLVPTFKAGIHCGDVVVGEVGIVKRDITYSGDVLNTTSRIQEMCKEFNKEVIVSGDLASHLRSADQFTTELLGTMKLRGKEKELSLNSIATTAAWKMV